MDDGGFLSGVWVDDQAMESMQATDEEVEHVEHLRELQSKQRASLVNKHDCHVPSMIIDDFLYQGTIEHVNNVSLLEKLGIQHILNASNIPLGKDFANKYDVLWIDLKDTFRANIHQHLDRTNEFFRVCRSKNEKVLVHCHSGVSRSSSIILAYLLRYYHDTLYNAYDYLLGRRCIARPNDGFLLQLIRYEKELRTSRTTNAKPS